MKKMMIPIIIIVALLIGGGAMFLILGGGDDEAAGIQENLVDYSPGAAFVVNLKDSTKTIRVEMLFKVVENDTILDELAVNNVRIRDKIIFILRELTYDEARADNVKTILNDRLVNDLNEELGVKNFREVYFSDFITG